MEQSFAIGRALTPAGVIENAVIEVADGRIQAITSGPAGGEFAELWAVPGFVDTHCHGAVGVSFGDLDPQANLRAIEFHRRCGTTTLFASTVTEPVDKLVSQLTVLRALVEAGELAGIHLEGPFLAPERKGAHDAALLRDPDPASVEQLIDAGGAALKMITMAPERAGAKAAIERFTQAGVKVAFGHSDADDAMTREGLGWGASVVTHLFNAMRPIHHRQAGPIPVLLTDPRVMAELICDGVHLSPVVAKLAIEAAGADRIAMVTDAMSATGHGDGRYLLGELEVEVAAGTARLVNPDGSVGAIAGSTLTMAGAFKFLVAELGCTIAEAAQLCATTPANWHGLSEVGAIEPGRWADLCLVNSSGDLHSVIRRGERVH